MLVRLASSCPFRPVFFKSEEARQARITLATPVRIGGGGGACESARLYIYS